MCCPGPDGSISIPISCSTFFIAAIDFSPSVWISRTSNPFEVAVAMNTWSFGPISSKLLFASSVTRPSSRGYSSPMRNGFPITNIMSTASFCCTCTVLAARMVLEITAAFMFVFPFIAAVDLPNMASALRRSVAVTSLLRMPLLTALITLCREAWPNFAIRSFAALADFTSLLLYRRMLLATVSIRAISSRLNVDACCWAVSSSADRKSFSFGSTMCE
mmetsp:Transcript_31164/g.42604  ORF Transcript_31164/g.42604 Transcript_31164/m.42604 type:complete len:218 (-) Transcript_31164:144-797(-)